MTFGPASLKQKMILQDTTTDVILIGGGAGGGKSTICLTKNLDGVEDPYFICTVLRRTQPELKRPGGLVSESKSIYPHFSGIYKTQAMKWVFPSGAEISFAAIGSDDDLGGWQGSQLVRVMIDEAGEEWTQHQVLFLLSRMRSSKSKIHPQLIMTANPNRHSFLKSWVDFCLDDEGVPKEGTENKIRWFVVENNEPKWADSPEELYSLYGSGKIMALGLSPEEMAKHPPEKLFIPKSFRFIPTNVYDNPYLLPPKNMSYLANLLAQPRVNQLRFLKGSWIAQAEGSGFWKSSWIEIVDKVPDEPGMTRVRGYDLAGTEKSEVNPDPDYTAGTLLCRSRNGTYYIEHAERYRKRTGDVIDRIISTAKYDGTSRVTVAIPKDPGQAGKAFYSHLVRVLSENGIITRPDPSVSTAGKVARFLPFASLCQAGNVKMVRGEWNDDFISELEAFDGGRKGHDDFVDSVATAFNTMAKNMHLPSFSFPNMGKANNVPAVNPNVSRGELRKIF